MIAERGTHDELLEGRGRYFDLYTRQAGLEANRFINPGETETEVPEEQTKRPAGEAAPLSILSPRRD